MDIPTRELRVDSKEQGTGIEDGKAEESRATLNHPSFPFHLTSL